MTHVNKKAPGTAAALRAMAQDLRGVAREYIQQAHGESAETLAAIKSQADGIRVAATLAFIEEEGRQ